MHTFCLSNSTSMLPSTSNPLVVPSEIPSLLSSPLYGAPQR